MKFIPLRNMQFGTRCPGLRSKVLYRVLDVALVAVWERAAIEGDVACRVRILDTKVLG